MFLLDTDALTASRRRDRAGAAFANWIFRTEPLHVYLSAISILEVKSGALRIARKDKVQGEMLGRWIHDRVLPEFAARIIPLDHEIALRCAALHIPDPRPERDAMIAATALEHRMIVVTRNVRDFAPMGVPLLNPWAEA